MMAFRLISSMVICGCLMIVNSQSVVDETEMSSQCNWDIEEYVRQSFERTCSPTHQLLMQVKQSIDSISDRLMTISWPQSQCIVEEKQHLVSAFTGKFVLMCQCASCGHFQHRIRPTQNWTINIYANKSDE